MAPSLNPEMLALAIDASGVTQDKLARATGLSQGFLSKAKNGLVEVSEDRLARIADALGYPPIFFLQGGRSVGIRCHHRKRQSMPVKRLRQIEARLNILRMQVTHLLQDVDIPEPRFPRLDVDAYESVEDVAAIVRRTWQLPMGPIRRLVRSVEQAGGVVVRADFGTDQLDALSHRAPDGRPFFYLNARGSADRWRFNLAHELGHIFMHSSGSLGDQEQEAHRFAGAFLMPPNEIRPQLAHLTMAKLADLKAHWLVSMQAIIQHAYRLGKLTDRQRRNFFTRMNQLGYRKNEPIELPQEAPALISQVVELHMKEHEYSIEELSRLARMHEADFRSTYLPGETPRRLQLVR